MDIPRSPVMLFPSGKDGSPSFKDLKYPRYVSPKLEGSYCLVYDGQLYTRRLKLHANRKLVEQFRGVIAVCKEHNLVVMGEIFNPDTQFNTGQSIFRAHDTDPGNTKLWLFDLMTKTDFDNRANGMEFTFRWMLLQHHFDGKANNCGVIPQVFCYKPEEAEALYLRWLDRYEGAVCRDPRGYYKYGRCTAKENNLSRHRPLERCDGIVLEVIARQELKEGVERTRLLDGTLDRVHTKDSYRDIDIAGSLWVKDEYGRTYGVGFGKGWDDKSKRELWANRDKARGMTVEIEYNPNENKDAPRQPKLVCFREDK